MSKDKRTEHLETVKTDSGETHPASPEDVERAAAEAEALEQSKSKNSSDDD